MTKYANLYAGPGTGKSTTAAKVFAMMKENGHNVEITREYVKKWAWQKRSPVTFDQFYFFGKQVNEEYTLLNKVEAVISDSPSWIVCYYTKVYGEAQTADLFLNMYREYRRMMEKDGATFIDIFLTRKKAYNPKGRFQTEDEARAIDNDMLAYMRAAGIDPLMVDGDEHAAVRIAELLSGQ